MNATNIHVLTIERIPVTPMVRQKTRKTATALIDAPLESMNLTNTDSLLNFHNHDMQPSHKAAMMTFRGNAKKVTGKSPASN